MPGYNIAVLDVGKTNKKLFVYDSDLACLNPDEKGVSIGEVDSGGLLCDDMPSIHRWMLDGLRRAARVHGDIRVISVSTHGATIALLGKDANTVFPGDGGLAFPIVSYRQEISPEDDEAFYRDMALSPDEMQRLTGTARFGQFLNHAKQVHWLRKRFPSRFAKVTDVLMFPSYLSYLLTGAKSAEPTYVGCHGCLLDISGRKYSLVADRLGISDKLPPLPFSSSWRPLAKVKPEVARETGLSPDTIVTVGVHDSNAALVPYFAKGFEDFVVQDSGTWVVTMSPVREASFSESEIGKEVFFNRSVYGGPVKTTIFRGGAEFDFYGTRVLPHWPHPARIDLAVLGRVLAGGEAFALPTVERGSGLFPTSVARLVGVDTIFRDAATAWCVVDLGLAIQGCQGIRLAAGGRPRQIVIEGNIGRNNPLYRSIIATVFPDSKVSFGAAGGAAYGAAILGAAGFEGKRPEDLSSRVRLDLVEVPGLDVDRAALEAYARCFVETAV